LFKKDRLNENEENKIRESAVDINYIIKESGIDQHKKEFKKQNI
jgi:hypothetical protein